MSINTHISLPNEARWENVVEVMGILAGLAPVVLDLPNGGTAIDVPGAQMVPCEKQFGCGHIELSAPDGEKLIDGKQNHSCFVILSATTGKVGKDYHRSTCLWLSTGFSDFWTAIGRGLVEFFGGELDLNDCDLIDCDFARPVAEDLLACDGEGWEALQARIAAVQPVKLVKKKGVNR
jgi:hypothetical protein